ncbi:MAG: S1 RNA-binding domain-containing protein [SAR324 cluster bacterium]|nr:S1 RNA-binding domain-containing protein [SAR324 cluster bacterium]
MTADSVEPGTELTGTVVGISGDDVFLEFGPKSQGSVPKSQFGKKEVLDRGRRVDVVVERYDAESGLLIVSRKGAVQRATWANLTKGQIVQGRVTGVVKGGLEMSLSGIRAFMPASQVDIAPMKDVSVLLNESLEVEIIEFDRRAKNVLVSRRRLLEKQRTEAKEKLKAELEVAQVRQEGHQAAQAEGSRILSLAREAAQADFEAAIAELRQQIGEAGAELEVAADGLARQISQRLING